MNKIPDNLTNMAVCAVGGAGLAGDVPQVDAGEGTIGSPLSDVATVQVDSLVIEPPAPSFIASIGSENQGCDAVSRRRVYHSITLEALDRQRQIGNWGADRILLDGIQNHLPGDSGGSRVGIRYLIQGRWCDHREGQRLAAQGFSVEAVEFWDDGRGFDFQKLGMDYSDKPVDAKSLALPRAVGQFGEGLKRAAASSLLEGMRVLISSRNWRAIPTVEELTVDGKQVRKLVFDVEVAEGKPGIKGSRTLYIGPTQAFLGELAQVDRKVLVFRPDYHPISRDEQGNEVVDLSGDIFVRGVFVTPDFASRLLYGYNLNTDQLPRDRDNVKEQVLGNLVGALLAATTDTALIGEIIRHVLTDSSEGGDGAGRDLIEKRYLFKRWSNGMITDRTMAHPELWKKAFEEVFGTGAVLRTNSESAKIAELSDRALVICSDTSLRDALSNQCGIAIDKSLSASADPFLLAEIPEAGDARLRTFETSDSLSKTSAGCDMTRVLLDAIINHTPQSSGGKGFEIRVKLRGEEFSDAEWVAWEPGQKYDGIEEIQIRDDGAKYDCRELVYGKGGKSRTVTRPRGEALRRLSSSVLSQGDLKIRFRSGNWVAMAFASAPKRVGDDDAKILCFQMLEGVSQISGSETLINGHSEELAGLLAHLDDYVLALRKPLRDANFQHEAAPGRLFREDERRQDVANGSLFSRGVFVTDSYSSRLLFSYDLKTDPVSSGGDQVDLDALRKNVSDIVASCDNQRIIAQVLRAASDGSGREYLEFIDAKLPDKLATVWKNAFVSTYGGRAVLLTEADMALSAQHLGFKVVRLNEKIARTLHEAGIEYDREIVSEGLQADEIPIKSLTPSQRDNLRRLRDVDKVFGWSPCDVVVFDTVRSRTGRDLTNLVQGFWNGAKVWMKRTQLGFWSTAVRTYVHERGHAVTGAADPTDAFRIFFESNLALLLGQVMASQRGDRALRIDMGEFRRDDVARLETLTAENAALLGENASLLQKNAALEDDIERLKMKK